MKKLIYAFSAVALMFVSCSSDSESSDSTSGPVLLKRSVEGSVTTNFNYNGTKLVSAIDNTEEVDLYVTYTGDNITKIEYKDNDGVVEQIENYTYDGEGKLTSYVRLDPVMDWGNKEIYTYNVDGTVSVEHYIGDTAAQTDLNNTAKVFFTNGEVTKIEEYVGDTTTVTRTYTYDTANAPLKNVAGFSKIAFVGGFAESIAHNILTETETASEEYTRTIVYTYNAANYPVMAVVTDAEEETTTQFFYE